MARPAVRADAAAHFARHRTKYLDMPVLDSQAFVFTEGGRPGPKARTLKELTGMLATLSAAQIEGHLNRHDFSRWLPPNPAPEQV
jgi:hypothetical protein